MDLAILKNVSLFEGLNHAQIQKIADIAVTKSFEGSAHIFREGELAKRPWRSSRKAPTSERWR
jgi:hypothetical protein